MKLCQCSQNYILHMKFLELYLCFHNSCEIWRSFSRTPKRNFLWCYYASVNSSCAQATPPQATAGNLPAFSAPGVGHLQILHCPGAGHLPTPAIPELMPLACSKRSDSGERCEVKKEIIFSRSFLVRTAPHYLNAWNRLLCHVPLLPRTRFPIRR